VQRARGGQAQARSTFLPQLSANASYTRTLKSQFEGAFGAPDTSASGPDFSNLPFGQANTYVFGLQGQWTLFNGMRNFAGASAAAADTRAAETGLTSQRAALLLTAAEYYYDALLADRPAAIAESTLAQTEAVMQLAQESLPAAIAHGGGILGVCFLAVAASLALIAAIDVPLQIWHYRSKLKMSRWRNAGRATARMSSKATLNRLSRSARIFAPRTSDWSPRGLEPYRT
jgi:hypothetical protein